MRKCLLNKEEFKFFKKNPHCTASLCSLDRLTSANSKNLGFIYNKETPEEIDETGFTNIQLKDVKRHKLIYETVVDLIPDAIKNMGSIENVKYQRNAQRPTTSIHIGQLKLFLATMQFLVKYSKKGVKTHVVYPGSAPGNNIDLLTKLFPDCYWYLYDPRDVFFKNLYSNPKVKKIVVDFFLDEHMTELQEGIPSDERMLLISDIRVCADVTEATIDRDMKLQADWVKRLNPDYAMLKFRLPRDLGNYKYLPGEVYLQMFAPGASTETRLVVDGRNLREVEYNLDLYEGLMYFFNRRARLLSYSNKRLIDEFDGCHDCVAAFSLIEDYIDKFNPGLDSRELMQKIIDEVIGNKLKRENVVLRKNLR